MSGAERNNVCEGSIRVVGVSEGVLSVPASDFKSIHLQRRIYAHRIGIFYETVSFALPSRRLVAHINTGDRAESCKHGSYIGFCDAVVEGTDV
jgi:hypothetical protein